MRRLLPLIALLGCTSRYVVEDKDLARAMGEKAPTVPASTRAGDPVLLRTSHILRMVDENPPYSLVEVRNERESALAVGAFVLALGAMASSLGAAMVADDADGVSTYLGERFALGGGVLVLTGGIVLGVALDLDGPEAPAAPASIVSW